MRRETAYRVAHVGGPATEELRDAIPVRPKILAPVPLERLDACLAIGSDDGLYDVPPDLVRGGDRVEVGGGRSEGEDGPRREEGEDVVDELRRERRQGRRFP